MGSRFIAMFLYMIFFTSGIALAQDAVVAAAPACTGLLCQVMGNFPEINAWLIAVFTFIGITLRAAAELIGFASSHLKKSDNGWAQRLGDWAVYCASVVGWFGGGTPKVVLQSKVDAASKPQAEKIVAVVDNNTPKA